MGSKAGKSYVVKILRHVKELLKSHGDEQTKLSFPSPVSYCSRGVYSDSQSALVVKLGDSPSRSRLITGSPPYWNELGGSIHDGTLLHSKKSTDYS
jgi:hypothetical protein